MQNYQDLLIWRKANELAIVIYEQTDTWPKKEIFGLISQIRRSVVSVPTNIVEGWARFSKKEFKRFLIIARGSLYETEYLWELAYILKYIQTKDYRAVKALLEDNKNLLNRFIKSMKE